MPSMKKKLRKDGSMYYLISVSRGYGKSAYTMRWDMPEGLSAKTVRARLQQAAYEFERDCKAGKVKTRKEKQEEERQAEQRRALEAKNRLTFQRFCEESFLPDLRRRCSENTAYNYRLQLEKHIYPDIGGLELSEMKSGDINALLRKHQTAGNSLSTAVKVYTIVRAVMKMAYKDELIDRNPMDKVDRPRKYKDSGTQQGPMACTVDELQRLCGALEREPLLWQTMVHLLIDSGIRVGECVGLLWRNVDFEENTITVDGTMIYSPDKGAFRDTTKNGKSRTFGVDGETMRMLKRLKEKQTLMGESAYVFTNEKTGKPLHPDSPRSYLKKLGERCGIEGLHPHKLRHSFASVAITNGADIASVSEKLGHSDKAVTLRMYTHADKTSIERASEAFRTALTAKKNFTNKIEESEEQNEFNRDLQQNYSERAEQKRKGRQVRERVEAETL